MMLVQILSVSGGGLPSLPQAEWSVGPDCSIISANFTFIFVHRNENPEFMSEDMRRLHYRVEVPSEAEADGHCGDQQNEITLHWKDSSGDRNLLNLVVTKKGRLAGLTGVFARLHLQNRKHELTSNIDTKLKQSLSWPFRYCLSCQRSLYYPLYEVQRSTRVHQVGEDQTDIQDQPVAFIVINNLVVEVFRDDPSLELLDPELLQQNPRKFYRRSWECEFHHILDWAPPVVGGTLLALLGIMVISFFLKSCLGCSDYQRQRGYQKI